MCVCTHPQLPGNPRQLHPPRAWQAGAFSTSSCRDCCPIIADKAFIHFLGWGLEEGTNPPLPSHPVFPVEAHTNTLKTTKVALIRFKVSTIQPVLEFNNETMNLKWRITPTIASVISALHLWRSILQRCEFGSKSSPPRREFCCGVSLFFPKKRWLRSPIWRNQTMKIQASKPISGKGSLSAWLSDRTTWLQHSL